MLDNSTQSVIQTATAAGLPTLSVLVGILINNTHLNDLRADMRDMRTGLNGRRDGLNHRIDEIQSNMRVMRQDLIHHFDTGLQRFEEVMDSRLKHLEERQ